MAAQAPAAVALQASDREAFFETCAPLRAWLIEQHGRRGIREGALGVLGSIFALVGLFGFGWSPTILMWHLIVALVAEGLAPAALLRSSKPRPDRRFTSPAHALAFVDSLDEMLSRPRWDPLRGHIPEDRRPLGPAAARLAPERVEPGPGRGPTGGWPGRISSTLMALVVAFAWVAVISILVLPVGWAAVLIFEPAQWWAFAFGLAFNAAHARSVWSAQSRAGDAPWQSDWFIDKVPGVGDLLWWKHFRAMPVFVGFLAFLFLVIVAGSAAAAAPGYGIAFAGEFESRLGPVVSVFLGGSLLLHLLLLTAPREARRRVERLDRIEGLLRDRANGMRFERPAGARGEERHGPA